MYLVNKLCLTVLGPASSIQLQTTLETDHQAVRFTAVSVLASLCSASCLGCEHDTARICCWPPCCCGWWSKGGRACCRRAVQRSIDVVRPTAANPPHAAAAGEWDRQTDGKTDPPVVYWGVYAGIRRIPTSGVFWRRIVTSVIINKQGTFRPFATPLCVYPPPFLAIHHWDPWQFHRPCSTYYASSVNRTDNCCIIVRSHDDYAHVKLTTGVSRRYTTNQSIY